MRAMRATKAAVTPRFPAWRTSRLRSALGSALAGLALVAAFGLARADLTEPSEQDTQITKAVTALLRAQHLSRHPLDDEISARCLEMFIKTLDPMKVYFYQSDVDRFNQQRDALDDFFRKGEVGFGYEIFQTFLERVDERVGFVDHWLSVEHDFTVQEQMVVDADEAQFAQNEGEARELWRKRIKYDLLVLHADDIQGADATDRLTRRYHSFARRMHQFGSDELLEMYLTSLTSSYDPHTSYMSPSTLENFEISMRLQLDGIGAALQFEDGYTNVNKIIPGGAADRDGRLKAGDRIVGVGQGESGEITDVVDMSLADVVDLIRGKRGTIVRLEVIPAGQSERQVYAITREEIKLTDSEARGEVVEHVVDGRTFRIGAIDLPSFYMDMDAARAGSDDFKSTTRDVARLLEGFQAAEVDAVVLDLRRNGGGSLTEAINLTGLFIDHGPVVQVKDADGRRQTYEDEERGVAWSGPLVVLTSRFSASASEILAGAIQDYGRGIIVGDDTTHGKGTVQQMVDLGRQLFRGLPNSPELGALKITMQQFYRPNGDSTQNRGVVADVVLPSLTAHLEGISESDLDFALEFDRIDPVEIDPSEMVTRSILRTLRERSAERCGASEDFARVERRIALYEEQKGRDTVTLNEEAFLAERAELNAENAELEEAEALNDPNRPVFETDYYGLEALAITADYVQQLDQQAVADDDASAGRGP